MLYSCLALKQVVTMRVCSVRSPSTTGFGLLLLFGVVYLSSAVPSSFKCVTWNVNGAAKLNTQDNERKFLAGFDVVFLQETYSGSSDAVFNLDGYIPHHQLGRPTLRRFQWGVSTLMRIEAFVGGVICRIPCPVDWMVVSRWRTESDLGLLLVNVYHPVHSDGFDVLESQTALAFLSTLRDDFPGDGFILGGDLNIDRWRIQEQRASGQTISTNTRLVIHSILISCNIPILY
jgi:exonuclease III